MKSNPVANKNQIYVPPPLSSKCFSVRTWDGVTNPFDLGAIRSDLQLQQTMPLERSPSALACLEYFFNEFNALIGSPKETASPLDEQRSATAQATAQLWSRRILKVFEAGTGLQDKSPLQSASFLSTTWNWPDLVDSYPWQSEPPPIDILVHPIFKRPFTAIGPITKLFVTAEAVFGLDALGAARFVHELAHIDDGSQLGWATFQTRNAVAIETPAIQAELIFLKGLLDSSGGSTQDWKTSPLRRSWNQEYAHTQWRDAAEARLYLDVVEQLDPL
jgi:hypothetical protein